MVVRSIDGRTRAVKLPRQAGAGEREPAEAALLGRLAHPGIVRLVTFESTTGELILDFVSDSTLATEPARSLPDALRILAATAQIVADLHGAGIVHGSIRLDHVLLARGARPVLCGFGLAGPTDQPFPTAPEDPAAVEGANRHPSVDVYGLGHLAEQLVAGLPKPTLSERATRRGLERLIRTTTSTEPMARPSAVSVAATANRLAAAHKAPAVPNPSAEPDEPDGATPIDGRPVLTRTRILVAIAAAVVGLAVGAVLRHPARSDLATPTTTTPGSTSASTTSGPSTSSTSTSSTSTSSTSTSTTPLGPLVVEIDGARYEIGQIGDQIATGDWDCDGDPTVALLRPSTGGVYIFTSWAVDGGSVTAAEVTRVDGALALRRVTGRDGCDVLELNASGRMVVLDEAVLG